MYIKNEQFRVTRSENRTRTAQKPRHEHLNYIRVKKSNMLVLQIDLCLCIFFISFRIFIFQSKLCVFTGTESVSLPPFYRACSRARIDNANIITHFHESAPQIIAMA